MTVGFPVVVVIVILAVVLLVRQPDPLKRARVLKRAGFGVTAFFTAFFGLFVVGETFTDPGGWRALGLVAAWAAPLAVLVALALYRPDWATRLLAVLTAAVVGVSIWFAVSPEAWRAFEDRNGPIRAIISFVLAAAVALLGLKRTGVAGLMLLVLGVVPVVSSLGSHLGSASLTVVSSAPFITGVLYLWSAALAGRSAPPAGTETRNRGWRPHPGV
jgi:hypothetical protein